MKYQAILDKAKKYRQLVKQVDDLALQNWEAA